VASTLTVPPSPARARLVVFVSGAGTNLQALIDACRNPDYGARIAAVGADRDGIAALERAAAAGIPTFVHRVKDYPDRASWDRALIETTAQYSPDLLVSAGFMKLFGPGFLAAFPNRIVNTHPALTPAFPGMHAVRDALGYGAKVTGCTLFLVADGVDDGPVIGQVAVPVQDGDDEESLHERIKVAERALLVDYVGRMARGGWTIAERKVTVK
jgi:formyltetrahydrofolate-dependent phosphoribosylglycinamide formyltransferase